MSSEEKIQQLVKGAFSKVVPKDSSTTEKLIALAILAITAVAITVVVMQA